MILKEGDTVIVYNTTSTGETIEEGIATIMRITKRLDYYMIRFEEDTPNMKGLYLRFISPENVIK